MSHFLDSLPPVAGLALSVLVSAAAWKGGSLTRSGAVAAALLGWVAMMAGWRWGVLLVSYFLASTLLSRFGRHRKLAVAGQRIEKGGPRDATQVMANGGVFGVASVAYVFFTAPVLQVVAAGALAASAADTWATEIGTLARQPPRSILTGRLVAVGTSGGVTAVGMLAALGGTTFIATLAWALGWPESAWIAATVGGISGCLIDSVLGASLQARLWCASCGMITEQRVHVCSNPTTHAGGVPWLGNDGVNAWSTAGGALLGAAVAVYL